MLFLDDQHRAVGVAQRSFRYATEEKPAQPGSPMTTHDDHRDAEPFGLARDDVSEVGAARQH